MHANIMLFVGHLWLFFILLFLFGCYLTTQYLCFVLLLILFVTNVVIFSFWLVSLFDIFSFFDYFWSIFFCVFWPDKRWWWLLIYDLVRVIFSCFFPFFHRFCLIIWDRFNCLLNNNNTDMNIWKAKNDDNDNDDTILLQVSLVCVHSCARFFQSNDS